MGGGAEDVLPFGSFTVLHVCFFVSKAYICGRFQ